MAQTAAARKSGPQRGQFHVEEELGASTKAAAARTSDASIRRLLDDLAQEERSHQNRAEELTESAIKKGAGARENEAQKKLFLLQIIPARDWRG